MIKINVKASSSNRASKALNELNHLLKTEGDLQTIPNSEVIEGSKADIITSLTIASVAISAISTFISILTYWDSKNPKNSISVKIGDKTFVRSEVNVEEFENELKESIKYDQEVLITIEDE